MIQIDDPFWAQLVDPALTSLAQPIRNMAQSAIDLLLQRIRKERDASKHIVFQFELRERNSVAVVTPESAPWATMTADRALNASRST